MTTLNSSKNNSLQLANAKTPFFEKIARFSIALTAATAFFAVPQFAQASNCPLPDEGNAMMSLARHHSGILKALPDTYLTCTEVVEYSVDYALERGLHMVTDRNGNDVSSDPIAMRLAMLDYVEYWGSFAGKADVIGKLGLAPALEAHLNSVLALADTANIDDTFGCQYVIDVSNGAAALDQEAQGKFGGSTLQLATALLATSVLRDSVHHWVNNPPPAVFSKKTTTATIAKEDMVGAMAGIAAGGSMGAFAGSLLPGVGTALGGLVGGLGAGIVVGATFSAVEAERGEEGGEGEGGEETGNCAKD